jgi:hypothetical protein
MYYNKLDPSFTFHIDAFVRYLLDFKNYIAVNIAPLHANRMVLSLCMRNQSNTTLCTALLLWNGTRWKKFYHFGREFFWKIMVRMWNKLI